MRLQFQKLSSFPNLVQVLLLRVMLCAMHGPSGRPVFCSSVHLHVLCQLLSTLMSGAEHYVVTNDLVLLVFHMLTGKRWPLQEARGRLMLRTCLPGFQTLMIVAFNPQDAQHCLCLQPWGRPVLTSQVPGAWSLEVPNICQLQHLHW